MKIYEKYKEILKKSFFSMIMFTLIFWFAGIQPSVAKDFHSSTGVLYGVLKCGAGSGGPHFLVTIDTDAWVITSIGPTGYIGGCCHG